MRFEGGKELADALRQLPARVGRSVLIQALKDAAEPMRERASRLAPHEPGAPDLRDNIEVSTIRRRSAEETEASVAMGPTKDFFYGIFQEWGTVFHGAHPFMRPAFDQEASPALKELRQQLWAALASKGIVQVRHLDVPLQGEV